MIDDPLRQSGVPQAEADRQRFLIHHLFTCPECLATGRCATYRAMLAEQLGDDLAAYVLGEKE